MISEIIMPDLGATGGDVTLQEWLVKTGDDIQAGQPLFLVITDKATVEVEAFRSGVVRKIQVEAGENVPLGAVLGWLADSMDEPLSQPVAQAGIRPVSRLPERSPEFSSISALHRTSERILATPIARRIAAETGLDLASVSGSGGQGQVLKRDVLAALQAGKGADPSLPGVRQEPLSAMQRAIAERTRRSKSEIPHYYAAITVDMGAALDFRQQLITSAEVLTGDNPTITDLCLRAVALALAEFPGLNASFAGDTIRYHSEINLGLVVGLETGMIIPVIRHIDRLGLFALAAESKHLQERAQAGQLKEHEISGGTFTLSNLGMYGLDSFTAVINPPEAGILALGAIKDLPANFAGEIKLRPLMIATLSVDHRLVDGVTAAKFLQLFKNILENPSRLVMDSPTQEVQP